MWARQAQQEFSLVNELQISRSCPLVSYHIWNAQQTRAFDSFITHTWHQMYNHHWHSDKRCTKLGPLPCPKLHSASCLRMQFVMHPIWSQSDTNRDQWDPHWFLKAMFDLMTGDFILLMCMVPRITCPAIALLAQEVICFLALSVTSVSPFNVANSSTLSSPVPQC